VLGPLAGGLVLGRLDLAPAAHLALLIPPILLCAACVAALRYAWRPAADSAAQSSPS